MAEEATPSIQSAIDAMSAGEYTTARRLFRELCQGANPRSQIYRRATTYLRHLGESDDDPVFQLLLRLRQASDAEERLSLIRQAREQNLEFGLDGRGLDEWQQEADQDLAAQADMKAQQLLLQAQASPRLDEAIELCRSALQITGMSEEMAKAISAELSGLEKRRKAAHHYEEARKLLEKPTLLLKDYKKALELAEKAKRLSPADSQIATFWEDTQTRYNEGERLLAEIAEAEKTQAASPRLAMASLERAQQEAEALGLSDLVERAKKSYREAKETLEKRIAQAEEVIRQGQEAEANGDLDTALDRYQQALEIAGNETDARDHYERIATLKQLQGEIKEYQERARDAGSQSNYGEQINYLKKALDLARKAQPAAVGELERQIQEAEKLQKEVEEARTTIKLQDLPYRTPQEYYTKREDISTKLSQAERDAMARVFASQATAKLRAYLQPAWEQIDKANWDEADKCLREGEEMWTKYLETEGKEIPSLSNRLAILAAQRKDVSAARSAYERLKPDLDRAHKTTDVDEKADLYASVLREFRRLPSNVRYILGERLDRPGDGAVVGVLEQVRDDFRKAVVSFVRSFEKDDRYNRWVLEAESSLRSGAPQKLEEARQIVLDQAWPLARRVSEYNALYNQFLPAGKDETWPIGDRSEYLQKLLEQIESKLRFHEWLTRAQDCLDNSDHLDLDGAESALSQARELDPSSAAEVDARLQKIKDFRNLYTELVRAEAEGDAVKQSELIEGILTLLPHNRWVINYRANNDVVRRAQEQKAIESELTQAENWIREGEFERAAPVVAKALKWKADHAKALQLQSQIERGQAGQQRRLQLIQEARGAFEEGNFQEAFDKAEKALAELPDREAQRLRDRAQKALALEQEAAELIARREYSQADERLRQVRNIDGVRRVSQRHQDWQNEIASELAAQASEVQLLQDSRAARERGDWLTVANLAAPLKEAGHVEANRLLQESRKHLCDQVRRFLEGREPEHKQLCGEIIRTLERHFQADAEIRRLRLNFDRVSRLLDIKARLARPALRKMDYDSILAELKPLVDEGDAEAIEMDKQARYGLLLLQAKQYEQMDELASAVSALEEARRIRSEQAVEDLYLRLKLRAALADSEKCLLAGEFKKAREALLGLESEQPAKDQIGRITRFERTMQQARQWQRKGDSLIPQTMENLDALLAEAPDFEPARNEREAIIQNLLQRGRDAEEKNDRWEAKRLYELLEQIAPNEAMRSNIRQIRQWAEMELSRVIGKLNQAIRDRDNLTTESCEALIAEINRLPQNERNQRRSIQDNLNALYQCQSLIPEVEAQLDTAERLIIEARRDKNKYRQADDALNKACAEHLEIFSQRNRLRKLRAQWTEQQRRHDETEQKIKIYQAQWSEVRQEVPLLNGDTLASVEQFVQEARTVIERALQTADEIYRLDPSDDFGLRQWDDHNDPDPLKLEIQQLTEGKQTLEQIGRALQDGLTAWHNARSRAEEAEKVQLTNDNEYDRAIRLWDDAAGFARSALAHLQQIPADPPAIPGRARALVQDAASIRQKANSLLEDCEQRASSLENELQRLQEEMRGPCPEEELGGAAKAENSAGNNWRRWQDAANAYAAILEINPNYQPAIEGRRRCQSKIKELQQRRPWWPYVLGGAAVVLISLLGWWFSFGPGAPPPPSPTPTPTQVFMPTSLPTPTFTPSPSATPAASPTAIVTPTPVPTLPPLICAVYPAGSAWVRSQPSVTATGVGLLRANTELLVVDFIERDDGRWYHIEQPVTGWIRAIEVVCPEQP